MTLCPNCGTVNRKGSRFCAECDQELPSDGIECPMCSTTNPTGATHCQECNARLVPMTSPVEKGQEEEKAQPGGQPSRPTDAVNRQEPAEDATEAVPREPTTDDWLSELRGSTDETQGTVEEAEYNGQSNGQADPVRPADIPDWLLDMGPLSDESHVPPSADGSSPYRNQDEGVEAREDGGAEETEEGAYAPEEPPSTAVPEDKNSEAGASPMELQSSSVQGEGPQRPVNGRGDTERTELRTDEKPLAADEASEDASETEESGAEERGGEQPGVKESHVDEPEVREPSDHWQEIPSAGGEMKDPGEGSQATSDKPAPEKEEPTDIDLPDWFDQAGDGQMESTARSADSEREATTGEEPLREEATPESDEIPAWLLEAERDAEELLPEGLGSQSETPHEEFELPEWLGDLMEERQTAAEEGSIFETETPPEEGDLSRDLSRADIPDWVHELSPGRDEGDQAPEGPVETEGLLKGLRGLLPASPGIEAPSTYPFRSVVGTSEASRARARLLESLLGKPVSRPRRRVRDEVPEVEGLVERWNVAIVLLISVLGMLVAPLVTGRLPPLTRPVADPAAARLYQIVNALDAADNVLIAFDYGAPEADELNWVARPVLEHLIDLSTDISIVSTRPDGLPVAAALMGEIAESRDRYTLVGYRPGAATAISQLLAAADDPPSLLVVVTSRPGPLQRWVEQANARYGNELQVVAAGSALIEPMTAPYLDGNAGQVSAAIHGLKGAASYEALLGARGGATQRLDALAAGHIAIVALMIAGAVRYGFGESEEGEADG